MVTELVNNFRKDIENMSNRDLLNISACFMKEIVKRVESGKMHKVNE